MRKTTYDDYVKAAINSGENTCYKAKNVLYIYISNLVS